LCDMLVMTLKVYYNSLKNPIFSEESRPFEPQSIQKTLVC